MILKASFGSKGDLSSILEWSQSQKNVRERSRGRTPPPPHIADLLDLMDPLDPMDLTDLTDPKHSSPRPGLASRLKDFLNQAAAIVFGTNNLLFDQ